MLSLVQSLVRTSTISVLEKDPYVPLAKGPKVNRVFETGKLSKDSETLVASGWSLRNLFFTRLTKVFPFFRIP